MSLKLSHSSSSRYQTCPTSYKHHYINKYRPKLQSSALCFGSSLDKAFEAMVAGQDPVAMFEKVWAFQEINKEVTYLADSNLLAYYKSDLEMCLLGDEDKAKLNKWLADNTPETRDCITVFGEILELKETEGLKNLHPNRQRFHNYVFWLSLRKKGLLMIEALKTQVLPKLTKIHTTQQQIKLKMGDGSSITGFTDLVADYGPLQNETVIFDLKTSSRAYENDSVVKSPQLALYVHALKDQYQTRKAGFIVLNKAIIKNKTKACSVCNFDGTGGRHATCNNEVLPPEGKAKAVRCGGAWVETFKPEIFVQILVDTIPEHTEQLVVENFEEINKAISSGVFVKNLQSCIMPYGPCSFYNLCHSGNVDDLIQMEDK